MAVTWHTDALSSTSHSGTLVSIAVGFAEQRGRVGTAHEVGGGRDGAGAGRGHTGGRVNREVRPSDHTVSAAGASG